MVALTLDSGALIAYERGEARVRAHLQLAYANDIVPVIPAVVLVEAWRGGSRSARLGALIKRCAVQPLGEEQARRAGELLGRVNDVGLADACVVATAAERGGAILTCDPDDIARLIAAASPALQLLTV